MEFEKLVKEALKGLPGEFREKLENVEIVIEDCPNEDLKDLAREGKESLLLGFYHGVPLTERTHYYAGVLPDKITLFKRNIEKICVSGEDIKEAIKKTVQHEIAHHFGITDERLKKLGLY